MKSLILAMAATALAAAPALANPGGDAEISVGGDTISLPIWECSQRVVFAHTDEDLDLGSGEDFLKLIDYGDAVVLTLRFNGMAYNAELPATNSLSTLAYAGTLDGMNTSGGRSTDPVSVAVACSG